MPSELAFENCREHLGRLGAHSWPGRSFNELCKRRAVVVNENERRGMKALADKPRMSSTRRFVIIACVLIEFVALTAEHECGTWNDLVIDGQQTHRTLQRSSLRADLPSEDKVASQAPGSQPCGFG